MTIDSFPTLQNDLILRAARGEAVERAPVWMMRQAGRYLPEYRAAREGYTFFETCRMPNLVSELTIQPVRRFEIDAAIVFSDILVVPIAMGMDVKMVAGTGPVLPDPIVSPADLSRLRSPDVDEELGYVFDAIRVTRNDLEGCVPLIGFSGAPWTLMAYMVEGGGSKSFSRARSWLHLEPRASHRLLDQLTDVVIEYLLGQIQAGAQMIQLFDSWAGLLGPDMFRRFELPQLRRIASALKAAHPEVPLTVFARGAHYALEDLVESDYDVISLDWTIDPAQARVRTQERITLQGNMDPAVLFATENVIRSEVRRMIDGFGVQQYIANLGHGMMPEHDPDRAAVFVEAVHSISSQLAESQVTTQI